MLTVNLLLFAAVIFLSLKLFFIYKSIGEITSSVNEILSRDTNILISISSRDRYVKFLAAELNNHLRLLRKQRRKFQSGDLELKDAIINISHDLRTPITAICGYLDLTEREEMPEPVKRYLSFIANRVDALKRLTEELFRYSVALSETETEEYREICLNDALEESVADFYAALTERGIIPEIKMPDEKIIRRLNESALARVFGNILNNAVKYSGGDLLITLSNAGDIIFTNTARDLDKIQTGKLFNRFFTVNAAQNSTGLGLSIARVLAERMNGTLTAEFKENKLSMRVKFQ